MTEPRRFRGDDFQLAANVAKRVAPAFEWQAEQRDYGWALSLTASHMVDGHEVRHAHIADQGRGHSIREQVAAAPTFEDFIRDWASKSARDLASRLGHPFLTAKPSPKESHMPKSKKPANKGGKKNAAPKKGLKAPVKGRVRKPLPKQAKQKRLTPGEQVAFAPAEGAEVFGAAVIEEGTIYSTSKPVWGDENSFGVFAIDQRPADDPYTHPAPPPPGPLSKFWRQYQDTETGFFIGWKAAAKLTKQQVVSRLRLRKPKA